MNAERIRAFLLTLPYVVETAQWDAIVFWVGDKAIGGKMFALMNPDGEGEFFPVSYPAGPERFADLLEREGIRPAPYFARIHWVAAERWDVFRMAEWESELAAAHALTLAKMPAEVKATLALPSRDLKQLINERRVLLAEKAEKRNADKTGKKDRNG